MILKSCHDDLICWKWMQNDRKNDKFWSIFLGLFILKPIILTSARYTFYNYPISVRMIFFSLKDIISQSKAKDPILLARWSTICTWAWIYFCCWFMIVPPILRRAHPVLDGRKKFNRKMISTLRKNTWLGPLLCLYKWPYFP